MTLANFTEFAKASPHWPEVAGPLQSFLNERMLQKALAAAPVEVTKELAALIETLRNLGAEGVLPKAPTMKPLHSMSAQNEERKSP